jgi:hypothetical protein
MQKYSIVSLFGTEILRYFNHFDLRACSAHWEILFFKFIPKPANWKKELDLRVRFVALAEFQSIIALDYLISKENLFVKNSVKNIQRFMCFQGCTTVPLSIWHNSQI